MLPAATQILDQLAALKQEHFTGQLLIADENDRRWKFGIFMGRLLYGTGGAHPVRRWQRQVLAACPQLDQPKLKAFLGQGEPTSGDRWEYEQLCRLVEQNYLSQQHSARVIYGILSEVLFDLSQAWQLKFQVQPGARMEKQLMLLDPVHFVNQQQPALERMYAAKIANYPFDRAPVIRQPEPLQASTSESIYQTLTKLLNGQHTLWDLAVLMKRPIQDVVSSLVPYVKSGFIELTELDDLPLPLAPVPPSSQVNLEKPLIACIDDSAWICQTLEAVVTSAGYNFLGIQDPLRAIPTLLSKKPALILLDLRMPNTNGYEICGQLRKLSAFMTTPIVILTGNDGIVDRVRAKMVGANDFLSKSVEHDQLLSVVERYLMVNA